MGSFHHAHSPNMVMSHDPSCKFQKFLISLSQFSTFNMRESHKISNGKVLYFRGYQPKTSWGTPPSVPSGLIDFFIQSHHHDLPYSKRSWKLILKTINSTAGYSPSHLYLKHTLIFLEISIFLKRGYGWNLKHTRYFFFKIPTLLHCPWLISSRKCVTSMHKRDAQ